MRFDWRTASLEDMEKFIAAARRMAQVHPHPQVRMFVFQLTKGIERFIKEERKRNAAQGQQTGLHRKTPVLLRAGSERGGTAYCDIECLAAESVPVPPLPPVAHNEQAEQD